MATSATVAQTIFTTQQVIDRAYQRAKIPSEGISGEQVTTAVQNLWLILQKLASQGVPVWRIVTQLLPLYQGQIALSTEPGTIEVLKVNLRTAQRLLGTYSSSDGTADLDAAFDGDINTSCALVANSDLTISFDSDQTITTIGLLPGTAGTWNFVYEISQDGVVWFTVDTFTAEAVLARVWLWNDYQITRWPYYSYARLRATGGTALDVAEFFVGNTPSAIPMSPLNKDDWFALPNKSFQGRPVQFWQDMRRDYPILNLWPVPDEAANFKVVEAQTHMMIEDVGTLTQTLDIPNRWYNAIIWTLAEAVADEMPDYKGDINRLATKAREEMRDAWAGVTPKGPMNLMANITGYTSG